MSRAHGPATGIAPWRDTGGLGCASLLLYSLLAQDAVHGLDAHVHVFFLSTGHLEHPFHLLYLKIAGLVWPVLQGLGLSPLQALRTLSALGTALGVVLLHRAAATLHMPRGHAALVTATSAVAPAVVFFATVPEIHGVFFAFAGLAWWMWARLLRAPRALHAVLLGVSTGMAASVHATGHLLWLLFAVCAFALVPGRSKPWRALLPAALAHAVTCTVVALALHTTALAAFGRQLGYLRRTAFDPQRFGNVLRVLRDEWLLAFAPTAVTSLAALLVPSQRMLAAGVAFVTLVYLAASYALLYDCNEHGAYLLPLAFPLAWLSLRACGARVLALAAAAALGLAVTFVRAHDRNEPVPWLPGLLSLAREQPPAMICRDVSEQEPITRELPDAPVVRVDSLLASADDGEAGYATFCTAFDATVAHLRASGRMVLITRGAHAALLASGKPFFVRFLRDHLPARYALSAVERDGFAALRLDAR